MKQDKMSQSRNILQFCSQATRTYEKKAKKVLKHHLLKFFDAAELYFRPLGSLQKNSKVYEKTCKKYELKISIFTR